MARAVGAEQILMFRVGQIIPPFLLEEFEVLNVHAARLPEYRGLASIYRALSERNFSQQAVLHRATSSIDGGEIIASRDFLLDDTEIYCVNEKIAYGTAIQLIIDFLKEAE
jgi:methionyl-tRNA formyltransferase